MKQSLVRGIAVALVSCMMLMLGGALAQAAPPIRVLFVGGDWKSQLPNYRTKEGTKPLRGYFVKQVVDKAAPGRFDFTLWTSYQFLQYGDAESLKHFDVIVVGDIMGQSVMPRLVKGVDAFVAGGGGLMYCDNHKGFSFNTVKRSFNDVLPVEVVPFRPMGPISPEDVKGQPMIHGSKEHPLKLTVKAPNHPVMKGLDFRQCTPLAFAHYGKVKPGATVLAAAPDGTPLWVVWDHEKGRVLYTGGFFANDESSARFCDWSDIGQLYVQMFTWLAAHSRYPRIHATSATATGTLTVDPAQPGPALSAKHFSIHGQEDIPHDHDPAELKLYKALNLDDGFARIGAMAIVKRTGSKDWKHKYPQVNPDLNLSTIDWKHYEPKKLTKTLKNVRALDAVPIGLFWMPWGQGGYYPDPHQWAKYYMAALETANSKPGTPDYHLNVKYFEPGNEPNLTGTLPQYVNFLNYIGKAIHEKFPGVQVGCLGAYEVPYDYAVLSKIGDNIDWISRHPYGNTGEAVFYRWDQVAQKLKAAGHPTPKYIITEWDFWIYGAPAFDYIMQRWKPLADHAADCLGSLQYRWNEYQEGGYVFGVRGVFNRKPGHSYGQLPPQWPNPGKDQPITYRYDAFWIMRDCRGTQYEVTLNVPDLDTAQSHHAYAIATSNGKQLNIVAYYGYPYIHEGQRFDQLKVHISATIPPDVKGRTLILSRADDKHITIEPAKTIHGNRIDTDITISALSGVSITVK